MAEMKIIEDDDFLAQFAVSKDAGARLPETDYKEMFFDLLYIKELSEKEKILDKIFDDDVKIPVAVYLFKEYKSEKAKAYISQNAKAVMLHLVEKGDMESIAEILPIVNKKEDNYGR